jgi:hypothetical protein
MKTMKMNDKKIDLNLNQNIEQQNQNKNTRG